MELVDHVYVFQFHSRYFGNDRTWYPVGVETDGSAGRFSDVGEGDGHVLLADGLAIQ